LIVSSFLPLLLFVDGNIVMQGKLQELQVTRL